MANVRETPIAAILPSGRRTVIRSPPSVVRRAIEITATTRTIITAPTSRSKATTGRSEFRVRTSPAVPTTTIATSQTSPRTRSRGTSTVSGRGSDAPVSRRRLKAKAEKPAHHRPVPATPILVTSTVESSGARNTAANTTAR